MVQIRCGSDRMVVYYITFCVYNICSLFTVCTRTPTRLADSSECAMIQFQRWFARDWVNGICFFRNYGLIVEIIVIVDGAEIRRHMCANIFCRVRERMCRSWVRTCAFSFASVCAIQFARSSRVCRVSSAVHGCLRQVRPYSEPAKYLPSDFGCSQIGRLYFMQYGVWEVLGLPFHHCLWSVHSNPIQHKTHIIVVSVKSCRV